MLPRALGTNGDFGHVGRKTRTGYYSKCKELTLTFFLSGTFLKVVDVQFQDGHSFSKKRMEEAFASGIISEPAKKASKSTGDTKQSAENIDIIVRLLFIDRRFIH